MKKIINQISSKLKSRTSAYVSFRVLVFLMLTAGMASQAQAQCTCTTTVSTNTAFTVGSGQTVCLTYAGTYTQAITLSGGTLCIGTGVTCNATYVYSAASSVNNNGTMGTALTVGNGYSLTNGGTITAGTTITVNNGGTLTNNTTLAGNITMAAGSTLNNNSTISGTLTNTGGAINNSGTISTALTIGGSLANGNAGVVNNLTVSSGAIVSNSGTVNGAITVNSGAYYFTNVSQSNAISLASGSTFFNLSPAVYSGTLTNAAGSTINNSGTLTGTPTVNGSLINSGTVSATVTISSSGSESNSGTVSGATTINSGGTLTNNSGGSITGTESVTGTLTNNGAISNTITVNNGGVFNNNSTTTLSAAVTMATGSTVNNYSTYSGSFTENGGTFTNYSGATMTPSAISLNGGTFTNSGTLTYGAITNNGANVTLSGTETLSGLLTSTGSGATMTIVGPNAHVNAGYTAAGGTTYISGGVTISGTVTNGYPMYVSGALTVTGSMTNTSTVYGNSTACNSVAASGSIANSGTFNGNGNSLSVSPAPSGGSVTNGAFVVPTQQPSALSLSLSGTTISGSFTSPSAAINGYLVLRYVGGSAPSCTPVSGTSYTAGGTVGACTVAAVISSSATGTVSFTDNNVSGTGCGTSVYYEIYSYSGSGTCIVYDLTSPLTGSKALPNPTASITASGATTFCTGGSVTLTATSGTGYAWSSSASTQAITASASGTYTVTVTFSGGCTATASQAVTVNSAPTAGITGTATACASVSLTATGGTAYAWSGGSTPATAANTFTSSNTYIVTVTNANGCTATASKVVTVNSAPAAGITGTATGCSSVSLNATGGSTYAWSGGSTPATAANTFTSSNTYVVTVTNTNGCTATASQAVTVNAAPSASFASDAPICSGSNLTVTATAVSGGPLTYSWSGPNGFTSSASSFTISSATTAASGSYTVTITGSNTCTTTVANTYTVANCLSVSGSVFDDANGNGVIDSGDSLTNHAQTLYSVIADTNGHVLATGLVASTGAFTMSGILPSTSGMTVRISTANPTIGSSVAAASWPPNWVGTLGQYGANNAAGTGVDTSSSELIPLRTGTANITGLYIGYDRLQAAVAPVYSIMHPRLNSVITLDSAAGLGNITWTDPEDGANKGSFVVKSVSGMNSNILFYDINNNNTPDTGEIISGYKAISNFNKQLLKIKFTGRGAYQAAFTFGYIDAAAKSNPTPSTYTVSWSGGALPVTLEYFTADKNGDHSSLLQWATATEIDNAYFEVERSADAQTWEAIGQVKGAGTTDIQQLYSYPDIAPMNGTNYYRLKQVDVDGNFVYTNVAQVTFEGMENAQEVNTMTMYPNPLSASAQLTIKLSDISTSISNVIITNAVGQVVFSDVSSQSNVIQLSGLNLPAGVYAVSAVTEGAKPLTSLLIIK